MALSKELLDILVCPKCKGEIQATEHEDGLVCERCRLLYPVRDDIPVMLIEEATPLAGPAAPEEARSFDLPLRRLKGKSVSDECQ